MERRTVTVQGIVQGVGFRPFVYGLAQSLGLAGFVQNQAGRVVIEVEGEAASLDRFLTRLERNPPPLARIEAVAWRAQPLRHDLDFRNRAERRGGRPAIFVSPDVATCEACLAELFDPSDRRHGYPFLNCTNCGPRLTIIQASPYDRVRTTMASFEMCEACRAGIRGSRQSPLSCAADVLPRTADHNCALRQVGHALLDGRSGRFFCRRTLSRQGRRDEGPGGLSPGLHATNQDAVAELRRRKKRDGKAFRRYGCRSRGCGEDCEINADEEALLASPRRPIVLLRKRREPAEAEGFCVAADRIADGSPRQSVPGVMLPYTPLHHLLRGLRDARW